MPETRYARIGQDHIAYQVIGDGPPDLVFMSAWFSHVDGRWEEPRFANLMRRLSSFSRLIVFDKRGVGASDPLTTTASPTWEDWADDVTAVMDAAGSDKAAILGVGDSGTLGMLMAAQHPDRVSHLILANTAARFLEAPDYPCGMAAAELDRFIERIRRTWGTSAQVDAFAPSMARDERYREWLGKYQRMGASPGRSTAMVRLIFEIDVRGVLDQIRVPTLVIHRKDLQLIPVEHGRYLAEHIKGAKLVECDGADAFIYLGNSDVIADNIEEFVTGTRSSVEVDRILATVMLTDMVGSTDRAAELGDARWRSLLDQHDEIVQRHIKAQKGKSVRDTGDGLLVTFEGPARGIRCANGIRDDLKEIGVDVRIGLHTGEIEIRGTEIGGIAVHIAARIMSLAGPGEILVSSTVSDLVTGSDFRFLDRGQHALKGVPREWQVYQVS